MSSRQLAPLWYVARQFKGLFILDPYQDDEDRGYMHPLLDRRYAKLSAVAFFSIALAACGGGGGAGSGGDTGGGAPGFTITGKVTFDRVPFGGPNGGWNFNSPVVSPAREVTVEAIDANSGTVLASTSTDGNGDYSIQVSGSRTIFMRAKAQMLKSDTAPTWNFRVLNNTNGDALYTIDGPAFPLPNSTPRNLHAAVGDYSTTTRPAAPFAILDTVYRAKQLILSADGVANFPALDLFWSANNRANATFCPDTGDINSSLYTGGGTDECNPVGQSPAGIYLLGYYNNVASDPDEFDQHVIAHEFGHYIEDRFGRSDSLGGSHSFTQRLDPRVAFGEGWGNAFGAMVLNDPVYKDGSFQNGPVLGGLNFETSIATRPGWFSEASVTKVLWDIFDGANEGVDTVALGYVPIHSVMTGGQRTTSALTTIFSFATFLKNAQASQATGIDLLLSSESISGSGEFAQNASNPEALMNVTPVYSDLTTGAPGTQVCGTRRDDGEYNKLSNRRFLRFDTTSGLHSFTVVGTVGSDPDFFIWRQGVIVDIAQQDSTTTNATETLQVNLSAGTHVIEVFDWFHTDEDLNTGNTTTCMQVSVVR